jgi:hypothetical protein
MAHRFIASTLFTLAALAGAGGAHAAGKVEVSYVEPDKFADLGWGTMDRERALQQMTRVLEEFAARLPDGQTLKFEVTDIDLAGEQRPGRAQDLRVLRGMADWPVVSFRYTLLAGNSTVKSGEAKVYDMAYQHGTIDSVGTNLPYERRMLRKWFAENIGPVR